jgi:autotransporter-associated beta strand protein
MQLNARRIGRGVAALSVAVGLACSQAHAASASWSTAVSGNWSDTTKWTPAAFPNGASDVATFGTGTGTLDWSGQTVTLDVNPTLGRITANDATAGGTLTLSGGTITLDNGGSKPVLDSTTFGESARFRVFSTLAGSNGFSRTGAGYIDFTGQTNTFAGSIDLASGSGFNVINGDANLGASTNNVNVTVSSSGTGFYADTSQVFTWGASRTITLSGGTGSDFWLKVKSGANMTFAGVITGAGSFRKNDAGTVTLTNANTYTGVTKIQLGTLALSGGNNRLPTSTSLQFVDTTGASTLNVGSTSQTVAGLSMALIATGTAGNTITGSGGTLIVNQASNLALQANVGQTHAMAGLSNLEINLGSANSFTFQANNVASVANNVTLTLANNSAITAGTFSLGGGASNGNNGQFSTVRLGTNATINSNAITVGGFNAAGVVNFQTGLTNPSLKIRAFDKTSRAATVILGFTSSGSRTGQANVDLTGGTLDALVTDMTIGRHGAGTSAINDVSTLTMPGGTLDATTLLLSFKSAGGPDSATVTSSLNVGGGTVKVDTLTLGKNDVVGGTPKLKPTVSMSGGSTLYAKSIVAGAGAYSTVAGDTVRSIVLNGATLRNYDASNSLSINGVDATGGAITTSIGTSGATIQADAGQSVTFGAFAPISGAGNTLTKSGTGTLYLNNSTTVGTLLVSGGTLGGSGSVATTSGLTVDVTGAVAPGNSIGSLTVTGNMAINGAYTAEVAAGPSADLIVVSGTLSLGASSSLVLSGTVAPGETYVLATYGSMSTGAAFASITNPFAATHGIFYGAQAGGPGQITLAPIPEPATAVVSIGGMLLVSLRRRR